MASTLEQGERWIIAFLLALLIGVLGYNWVQMDARLLRIEQVMEQGCMALRLN